jgi:hypothetical protein
LINIHDFNCLLVGASHYNRPHSHFHPQTSLPESVVHGVENNHSDKRRASSVQSLNKFFSFTTSSESTSYPHLQQLTAKPISSPTTAVSPNTALSPLTPKNSPFYTSLHCLENLSSRPNSISKPRTPEDHVQFFPTKSTGECVISTNLSKRTATITSENTEKENDLIKKAPVEIRVRCIFSRVGEIDTLNERYTAELFFEASWYEKDHKIGSKYDPQMGHFNPQLVVLNHIGDSLRHEVNGMHRLSIQQILSFRNGIQLKKRILLKLLNIIKSEASFGNVWN